MTVLSKRRQKVKEFAWEGQRERERRMPAKTTGQRGGKKEPVVKNGWEAIFHNWRGKEGRREDGREERKKEEEKVKRENGEGRRLSKKGWRRKRINEMLLT